MEVRTLWQFEYCTTAEEFQHLSYCAFLRSILSHPLTCTVFANRCSLLLKLALSKRDCSQSRTVALRTVWVIKTRQTSIVEDMCAGERYEIGGETGVGAEQRTLADAARRPRPHATPSATYPDQTWHQSVTVVQRHSAATFLYPELPIFHFEK